MTYYILTLIFAMTINSTCDPFLRIQPDGNRDAYIPEILLFNDESSVTEEYFDKSGFTNEFVKDIYKKEYNVIIIEKKYTVSLIKRFSKKMVTQYIAEQKNMFRYGTNKISYCIKSNKMEIGYCDDYQKLYFLKELRKIINKRYKNDKELLRLYNHWLDSDIKRIEYIQ